MKTRDYTDVGAVLVNFNGGYSLCAAIASLRREGVKDIVCVDNGSSDGSWEALAAEDPDVTILHLANLGFGKGVNRGVIELHTPYVMSLNPDATLEPGALATMRSVLETRPEVAVVGPRTVGIDGVFYPSARRFPRLGDAIGHALVGMITKKNPWSRRYLRRDESSSKEGVVDWVSGSAMLLRRSAFDAVGGFCPEYFMYLEDTDLCWQFRKHGWQVWYEPAATVVHEGGTSTSKVPLKMAAAHHRSALRFAVRTTTGLGRLFLPVIAVGLGIRLVVDWARLSVKKLRKS